MIEPMAVVGLWYKVHDVINREDIADVQLVC